jgi:hypothetical protein
MPPVSIFVCGMLDAGELNTKNIQDALKPTLCFFTAIFINELEVLRCDCL